MELLATNDLMMIQHDREVALVAERLNVLRKRAGNIEDYKGRTALAKGLLEQMDVAAAGLLAELSSRQWKGKGPAHRRARALLRLSAEQLSAIFFNGLMGLAFDDTDGRHFTMLTNTFNERLGREIAKQESYSMIEAIAKGPTQKAWLKVSSEAWAKQEAVDYTASRFGNLIEADLESPIEGKYAIELGMALSAALIPALAGSVEEYKESDGKHVKWQTRLSAELSEEIQANFQDLAQRETSLGFMVCPPSAPEKGRMARKYRYLTNYGGAHADPCDASEELLEAMASIQSVPYSANAEVMGVFAQMDDGQMDVVTQAAPAKAVEEAVEGEIATLLTFAFAAASSCPLALASPLVAAAMAPMPKLKRAAGEARRKHKAIRNKNDDILRGAIEALSFDAVYFPVYADSRGRLYQAARLGFGPQSSEVARGLLTFAAPAKPLGEDGLAALYYELANAWGYDKLTASERLAKAYELPVAAIAAAPLSRDDWMQADKPTKVLALCLDIAAAEASGNPAEYVSHQAVGFDGTNSGLQHMSLVIGDVRGALATNVIGSDDKRNDLYQEIATPTTANLKAAGEEELVAAATKGYVWSESKRVSKGMRDMVKTPSMTVGYGATKQGLPQNLLDAEKVDNYQQAKALADAVWQALEGALPEAMELRQWIQDVAAVLASQGKHMQWTTPNGTVCRQEYYTKARKMKSVRLLGRETNLPDFNAPLKLDRTKAVNSSSPNIIHSLDACAVQRTVTGMKAEGIDTFCFVHDQYDCSPADAAVLSRVLREAHVAMYETDVLGNLYEEFKAQANDPSDIPPPPVKGDLEVRELLSSVHFFA